MYVDPCSVISSMFEWYRQADIQALCTQFIQRGRTLGLWREILRATSSAFKMVLDIVLGINWMGGRNPQCNNSQ